VEPSLQLSEQLAVQTTWQVALPLHETLPLSPSVTEQDDASQDMLPLGPAASVQVLPPRQSALHEPAQVVSHTLASVHASEQEPPSHGLAACVASSVQLCPA